MWSLFNMLFLCTRCTLCTSGAVSHLTGQPQPIFCELWDLLQLHVQIVFEHGQIWIAGHIAIEKIRTHETTTPNASPNGDSNKCSCANSLLQKDGNTPHRYKTNTVDLGVIFVQDIDDLRAKVQMVGFNFTRDFLQEVEFPAVSSRQMFKVKVN